MLLYQTMIMFSIYWSVITPKPSLWIVSLSMISIIKKLVSEWKTIDYLGDMVISWDIGSKFWFGALTNIIFHKKYN